jgi:hypothetical protein
VCSLPRKNTLRHFQSPKLENPVGDDSHVGPFEEEHPETSVPIFAAKKQYSACSIVLLIGVAVVVPATARLFEHLDAHIGLVKVGEREHEADFKMVVAREIPKVFGEVNN